MKNVLISIIIALMAMNTWLYAQEKAVQREPKVDLQVVYEKIFDEPIVDVILGGAKMILDEAKKIGWREEAFSIKEKTNGKVKIFYPKVVITSRIEGIDYPGEPEGEMRAKEIMFYDENGKLTKTVSAGHRLLRSENGQYLVVANLFGDGYDKEGNYIYHPGGGVIYNWNGDEIAKIPSGRILQVSDNGYVLGEWVVYDSLGKETGRLEPNISEEYLNAEAICSRMSQNGEYVVTVLSMFGPKKALYILWDKTSRILWKKEFPFEITGSMPLSHSLIENVGITGKAKGSLIMIDWDGELLWNIKKPTGGSYRSKFSQDNKKVFMISTNGYVFSLDAHSGRFFWQHKADWTKMTIAISHPHKDCRYNRLLLLKNDEIIAARTFVGSVSGVIFLDANNGDLLWEATDYQNVSSLTSKNNILFIIEKHKLTGNVIVGGKK
jgi:hypothetical protein